MSPLTMGRAKVTGVGAEELTRRAASLGDALEAGGEQLDRRHTSAAQEIVAKVKARTALLAPQ